MQTSLALSVGTCCQNAAHADTAETVAPLHTARITTGSACTVRSGLRTQRCRSPHSWPASPERRVIAWPLANDPPFSTRSFREPVRKSGRCVCYRAPLIRKRNVKKIIHHSYLYSVAGSPACNGIIKPACDFGFPRLRPRLTAFRSS